MAIPPGFAQVTFVHSHPAAEGEVDVVFGVGLDDVPDVTTLQEIASCWEANILPQISNMVVFENSRMYVGQDPGDPIVIEFAQDPPVAGGDSGPTQAINTAYLVKKSSGLGGRRNRGRMFIPGVVGSRLLDNGHLSPTFAANLGAACDAFLTQLEAVTGVEGMVILHAPPSVLAPTVVIALTPAPKVATQRRRLRD